MLALSLHTLLMVAILAGLTYRGRWRANMAFPVYLAVGIVHNVAQAMTAPGGGDWLLWLLVTIVQRVVTLALAVEVGARIFHRHLQGGRRATGRIVLGVLGLGLIAAAAWGHDLGTAHGDRALYFALVEGGRRLATIAAAVLTIVVVAAVSYYGWPLDPYHRDLASGFWLYQMAFVLAAPWSAVGPFAKLWPVWLYGIVLGVWLWSAWRPVNLSPIAPEYRALVWPWVKARS